MGVTIVKGLLLEAHSRAFTQKSFLDNSQTSLVSNFTSHQKALEEGAAVNKLRKSNRRTNRREGLTYKEAKKTADNVSSYIRKHAEDAKLVHYDLDGSDSYYLLNTS